MKKKVPCLFVLILLGVVMTFPLTGRIRTTMSVSPGCSAPFEDIPGVGDPEVVEITRDVLAVTGLYHSAEGEFYVNAGIIFTAQGVIFIDSGMSIASGEFLWKVARKRMKGRKNLYLILTHHHSDHVFGMRVLKEKGAEVIAHRTLRYWIKNFPGDRYKKILAEQQGWSLEKADKIFGKVILSGPDNAVEKDTVLNIDGDEIHVLATPGHVLSELSVYHPKSKTLFAGDTIYEGSRLTTRFGGPEAWKQWISQLERLKKLEIKTIVPGHGKLCSGEEIDRNISCLREEIEKRKKSFPCL